MVGRCSPSMVAATPWACRPAALITRRQRMAASGASPVKIAKPSPVRPTRVTWLFSTTWPPFASRSACRASRYSWLSMMPVDGESSARTQRTWGSSSAISACSTHRRSSTPLARAWARYFSRMGSSSAVVATISLPMRR